eukprot:391852-Pyramimonas_sp.AAC.1
MAAVRTWKSVRPGKIDWREEDVKRIAVNIYKMIPPAVKQLVEQETMITDIVQPFNKDDPTNMACGITELEQNFVFLHPFIEAFPDKVPSAFMITDVMIMLNRLFESTTLREFPPTIG